MTVQATPVGPEGDDEDDDDEDEEDTSNLRLLLRVGPYRLYRRGRGFLSIQPDSADGAKRAITKPKYPGTLVQALDLILEALVVDKLAAGEQHDIRAFAEALRDAKRQVSDAFVAPQPPPKAVRS